MNYNKIQTPLSYAQSWVQLMMIMKNQIHFPKLIAMAVLFISQTQALFMIVEWKEKNQNYESVPNLIILLLIRTDMLLQENSLNFIIVLLFCIIQKIAQLILTCQIKKIQYGQFDQIENQFLMKFLLKSQCIFTKLQITIFHIPFSTICLQSFANSIKLINQGQLQYYIQLLLSLITYIICQLDYLIIFSIIATPLTYRFGILDLNQITLLHYLDYFCKQFMIVLFCFSFNQQTFVYIIIAFQFCSILMQLINQLYYHTNIIHRQLFYFTISINIIITSFYCSRFSNIYFQQSLIIPLIIYPIINNFLLILDEKIISKLFINILTNHNDIESTILYLKLIINQCDIEKQYIPIKNSLINRQHRLECKNEQCQCSQVLYISEISQANAISQEINKTFIKDKIKYLMPNKILQIEHLILIKTILLYDFGYLTETLKNLSSLVNNQVLLVITHSTRQDESFGETSTKKEEEHQSYLKIKLSLINKSKRKLKSQLGTSIDVYQQMISSDFMQQYLIYDKKMREIQYKIIETISQKIEFYYEILSNKKQDIQNLGQCSQKICLKLQTIKKELKQIYNKYPSISIQKCICFFECELLNNYYEANRTISLTSMQDDKLFRNKKIQNYDISLDKMAFCILSLKEDLEDFNIEQISQYLLKIIGFQIQTEILFKDILPRFVRNYHTLFVKQFFNDGQSKFYKLFNQAFIKTNLGFLKAVYISYDFTSIIVNKNILFTAFLQELQDQKSFIICVNKKLTFSDNFFKKIGFDSKIFLDLPRFQEILNGLQLSFLFPTFIDNKEQQNVEMRFLEQEYLQDMKEQGEDIINIITNIKYWQDESFIQRYNVSLIQTQKIIGNISYLLIEFTSITKTIGNGSHQHQIDIKSIKFQESSYFDDSILSLNEDVEANKINVFDTKLKSFVKDDVLDQYEIDQFTSFRKDDLQIQVPFQTHRQLLTDRKQQIQSSQSIQQEYFNIQIQHLDSLQKQSSEDQNTQKHHEHNPLDDVQSQQSSVGGLRESILYKKFEMIEKIIKNKKFDKLTIYIALLILQTICFIIYSILIVTVESTELLQFINEIDMISLHASIMAPHDMYLSIKVTISAYQQQYRESYINNSTLQQLINPLYQFNDPYYLDLQENFYNVLKNDNLQQFFTNQYETVYFMAQNDSVTYTQIISFREELLAILNAQYQFKRVFDARKNANGQACQVLQFANYFNLQDKLEQLTDEILGFSKNRSKNSNDKWLIIWISFQIVSFFIGVIAIYFKRSTLKTYEKLLSLFYYSDKASLEKEINKLKMLEQIIIKNNEAIRRYEFNFREQEELVNKRKKESTLSIVESTHKINKMKLRRSMPFIYFLCIYIFFCVYSVIILELTKTYLTKYLQTTDYYRLVQDLRFRSGNIYVYREFFFRWSNFTYLSNNDLNRLYMLVDKSQDVMAQFLSIQSQVQDSDYLFSDSYTDFINQISTSNLCNFIDYKYSNLTVYCPIALDGVLLKGMISSLTYISAAIKSQQAINNFTKRVEVHFYELEGAQVISLAFQNVSIQLTQGMIDLTENFNFLNEILSYFFLVSQVCIIMVYLTCFKKSQIKEFTIYKKSLYLIPIQVLLGDDALERALRQFEFVEKI